MHSDDVWWSRIEKIEHRDLRPLWNDCREVMDTGPDEEVDNAERIIKESDDLGQRAPAFRYWRDKNEWMILPSAGMIDLDNLRAEMEALPTISSALMGC